MIRKRLRASSLIETITAMALIAITLGLLFQTMSFDQLSRRSDISLKAIQVVDSMLLSEHGPREGVFRFPDLTIRISNESDVEDHELVKVRAEMSSGSRLFEKTLIRK